jgi:16S rRNA (adenine(1408)-N(1))-methyltransferase
VRTVIGNKIKEINKAEFFEITSGYLHTEIDLGTGDGRFIYKNSLLRKDVFFVGIDPAEKQLKIYAKKAVREKAKNLIYVIGSIEILPGELNGIADRVYINLPWGTLLENIVKPKKTQLSKLYGLLKEDGELEIILGYAPELEPKETTRLDLPLINLDLVRNELVPAFESAGFHTKEYYEMSKKQLAVEETTWAKRLRYGKDRKIYKMIFSS